MNNLKWLGIAAGIAALAACGGDTDEMNAANADLNATDNMMLPPEDNFAANVDMNGDLNNMAADTNATDNMANNTANAY
jgi:hypothetical protein